MATPLDMGLALSRAGFGMLEGWARLGETLAAAGRVIEHRSVLINDAARSPLEGDYAELARMIPEKLSAFSLAGSTWMTSCIEMQRQFSGQAADATRFLASGGTHPMAFLSRASQRANRVAVTALGASGAALAPVHRAATTNARRLKV